MTTYKKICFIPAKEASTRLKKKNLLKLKGKELIYYPITAAKTSNLFGNNIILSTESAEISKIAKKYGASVPYLREKKLAKDPYGVADVLLNFLEIFPDYKTYDNVCILLPTAPLMIADDIINAYNLFIKGNYNSLISVNETNHNTLRSVFVKNNLIEPIHKKHIRKKTQELKKTFWINGAVTFIKIHAFLKSKTYFMPPLGAYIMPLNRSVDIDNETDYNYAKFLIND